MQGAFNTKTKRQLEICKRVPLKLDFEVKFKDARVAFPNPSIHSVLSQGVTKALLSCWLLSPLYLIQSLGPNDHLCISQRGHTSPANSQQRQHPERKVQLSPCLLNVQTKLHISAKQRQDGEGSSTTSPSHQVLDHQGQPPALDAGASLVVLSSLFQKLQRKPGLPLLHPFNDKSFHKELTLKLGKVDQKYYECYATDKKTPKN